MHRFTRGLAIGCVIVCVSAVAADKSVRVNEAIDEVLRSGETAPFDRRTALAGVIDSAKAPQAWWVAGFVRSGDAWQPFETFAPPAADAERLEEYARRRSDTPQTVDGHIAMANWCRQKGLKAQETAHLMAAAAIAPQQVQGELLARAGYRQIGGQWFSPEQISEWQSELEKTRQSLKTWGPRLSQAAEQLASAGRKYRAGLSALDQVKDASAVPAIEWSLCGREEPIALQAVRTLAKIDGYEVSVALARQAVFNRWETVRELATESLESRKFEDFVPELIPLLATTTEVGFEMSQSRRGTLVLNYVLARETEDQFQVAALQTVSFDAINVQNRIRGRRDRTARDISGVRVAADVARAAEDELYLQQKVIDQQNERTAELNARVSRVLTAVSKEQGRETPRDWWNWWNDYNEYEKPKTLRRSENRRVSGTPEVPRAGCECFAAGTPVWTQLGLRPIESIRPGDLVLSQDVESGELGYQPVLFATIQQPKPLTRLKVGDESFDVTGGHRFWTNGQNWQRTRDLKTGAILHTARGSIAVDSATPGETAASYNLVVAGTHNYFVGQQALLSHDVTLPRSTNRKIPGLASP